MDEDDNYAIYHWRDRRMLRTTDGSMRGSAPMLWQHDEPAASSPVSWRRYPAVHPREGEFIYSAQIELDPGLFRAYHQSARASDNTPESERRSLESRDMINYLTDQWDRLRPDQRSLGFRRLQNVGFRTVEEIEYVLYRAFAGDIPRFGDITVIRKDQAAVEAQVKWYTSPAIRAQCPVLTGLLAIQVAHDMAIQGPSHEMENYGFHFDIRDAGRGTWGNVYAHEELVENEIEGFLADVFDNVDLDIPNSGDLVIVRHDNHPETWDVEWWEHGYEISEPSIYQLPSIDWDDDYESDQDEDDHGSERIPGATAEEIEDLGWKRITHEEAGQACSICMIEKGVGKTVTLLPCFHWFDQECVSTWLQQTASCPECRTPILD